MAKARILVVDDENLMREFVMEALSLAGHEVQGVANGRSAVKLLGEEAFNLVVSDLKMTPMDGLELLRHVRKSAGDTRCIIMTAYGTVETAVTAIKEGADDYILKPFAPDELEVAVDRVLENRRLSLENRYLRAEMNERFGGGSMVGDSPAMRAVYERIEKVADSRATILVRGESGTGKELVARAIHHHSPRKDAAFIKVNCAALSAGLLESELFGHEKGAFTGAHERKVGRFELADGGTLLLDEVSEIGADLQPKLLRVLQEREFERVGGARTIQVDVRIVATSNRDLEQAVEDGTLREDLFFRLNVIPIHLPPLRERPEDIPRLMEHFLKRFVNENGRNIRGYEPEVETMFRDYAWPGNVRELQNAVERAVVLANGPLLTSDDFFLGKGLFRRAGGEGELRAGMTVAEMERELIMMTLKHCSDNRTHAAKMLGISVRTLRNKLREYGVHAG